MNLIQIYNKIQEKIKNNQYHIVYINNINIVKDIKSLYEETINVMIYYFMMGHNDTRLENKLNYVCIPNELEHIDFSVFTFYEFFEFMVDIN